MHPHRAITPILLAGALLLAAQPSIAQTTLGIAAMQRASNFREHTGKTLTFVCPPTDGAKATVYGTDTCTDDSMKFPVRDRYSRAKRNS